MTATCCISGRRYSSMKLSEDGQLTLRLPTTAANRAISSTSDRIEPYEQKLSDDEHRTSMHLADCDDCRRRLETAAASEDIWSDVCDSLRDNHASPDDQIRRRLRSTGEDASSSQATILKLLAPTDDDRMIGRWGTYEVVGVVGTGGMGVVLKAFDAALNRYVAIKILAPHLGSERRGHSDASPARARPPPRWSTTT